MVIPKEIDKVLTDWLYELLMIKKSNPDLKMKGLSAAIGRTKASMTKENIAWVEQQIAESEHE